MKRSAALLLIVIALASAPAHAEPFSRTGTVRLGALSPQPARILYTESSYDNGLVGYVMSLPADADGKGYVLTRTYGPTGLEDLDAYFYTSLSSYGACDGDANIRETGATETGVVCPGASQTARYAIIVLKAGANTAFSLTINT